MSSGTLQLLESINHSPTKEYRLSSQQRNAYLGGLLHCFRYWDLVSVLHARAIRCHCGFRRSVRRILTKLYAQSGGDHQS